MATGRRMPPGAAVVVSIAVAAVAGLLVTAAALDDAGPGEPRPTTTTTTTRSTTTTERRGFPAGDEWSITTAVVPPLAATTTTATSTTTTVPGPPPVSPPAPGAYAYTEVTRRDSDGEPPGTAERVYRVEGRPPAEGEQRLPGELHFLVTLETEQGRVTTITSWRPDAVFALQTFFRMADVEGSCDWVPDLRQLQFALAPDARWTAASSCTADFAGQQVRIERSGEFRVVGDERINVAGEDVSVWRVESKETTHFGGRFQRTDQEIRTWWFSPKYGLTVREESRQQHTTPEGTTEEVVDRELVRLRPV